MLEIPRSGVWVWFRSITCEAALLESDVTEDMGLSYSADEKHASCNWEFVLSNLETNGRIPWLPTEGN